ncbi:MAG: B12-binding domain-containing radical SAM protein [Candidatus Hydrogenedentes bacterium]|nr:B12-binding domain-containing radical SAM protein [Candidatus Hydrogenedentota bacterium]
MRVQLLHPPIYVNRHAVQATRPSLPLGLAYIAAALRDSGHEVSVLDAVQRKPEQLTPDGRLHYVGMRPEEIVETLDPGTDAIGLSVMFSFTWPLVKRIVHRIREQYPGKVIVGGGEHLTGMPEYSLREAPFDCLVLGEGEATAQELFRALDNGRGNLEDIPGLAFLRDGRFVKTPPRERIREVDALRRPAWDLFDPEAYYRMRFVFGVDAGMTMPILATRGCPYECTYCSNAMMWGRRWYARDPAHVAEEIEEYHRTYGATNFPFHDLTAILKKSWIASFCEELLRRDLHITWQLPSGTRCEVVDGEVAALLRRTGGSSLTFAPESGSERTRVLVKKKMSEQDLMHAVRACTAERLNVSTFFVIGFPHDTREDLNASVRLAVRLAAAGVNDIALSLFFPIPNTRLYEDLVTAGRIQPSDEFLLTPLYAMETVIREEVNYCAHLTARQLTWFKYKILVAFYAVSFLVRPWRFFQILWNVVRGRETCKLDIFLNNRKRRLLGRFQA